MGGVGVLGGAGRARRADGVLDAGDAAGGALGAGSGFGENQPADAGPQTRAKAAIRVMRANMKQRNKAIRKGWLKFILPMQASPCDGNRRMRRALRLLPGGHEVEFLISREDAQVWDFRGSSSHFFSPVRLLHPNPLLYPSQFPLTCVRSQE
jgi:hypothetical protein